MCQRSGQMVPQRRFWAAFLIIICLAGSVSIRADETEDPVRAATDSYYRGRLTEAINILRRTVAASPGLTTARLNLACLLRQAGRIDEALSHWQLLSEAIPDDPAVQANLAETAFLAGIPPPSPLAIQSGDPVETWFWQALWLAGYNANQAAKERLRQLTLLPNCPPQAFYAMGLIRQKEGDPAEAARWFQSALNKEPHLSQEYLPLAGSILGADRRSTVTAVMRRLNPSDRPNPDGFILSDVFGATREESLIEAPPPDESADSSDSAAGGTEPVIRIGLTFGVGRLNLKINQGFQLVNLRREVCYQGNAPVTLALLASGYGVLVKAADGRVLTQSRGPLTLVYPEGRAITRLTEVLLVGGGEWRAKSQRTYRGNFTFIPGPRGMTIVNHVKLEKYLYSVVPSEIPAHWPPAALRAQAVAARTYALANLGRYASRGYDLLATPVSQVYNGVAEETAAVRAAVDSTRGRILTYEGKPAVTYYHDNSGGYTEDEESVWGYGHPYLKAVPEAPLTERTEPLTPADLDAWISGQPESSCFGVGYHTRSAYRWQAWISRETLESRIGAKARIGKVTAVLPLERGISGRVRRVLIRGAQGETIISGDSMRYLLGGLRSNLFVVEPKPGRGGLPEYFIFKGGGWGHGVGMSQSGAAGMAAQGAAFEQILDHYYPGTSLTRKY
jgi:stage II sporulation protein D